MLEVFIALLGIGILLLVGEVLWRL
jgi:hypothetical protein